MRLRLILYLLDRYQDPVFDTAVEVLAFVAEIERDLVLILTDDHAEGTLYPVMKPVSTRSIYAVQITGPCNMQDLCSILDEG